MKSNERCVMVFDYWCKLIHSFKMGSHNKFSNTVHFVNLIADFSGIRPGILCYLVQNIPRINLM